MSKDRNPLKEIIAKRYSEIKNEPLQQEVKKEDKKEVVKEPVEKTTVYIPHKLSNNNYYLLKVEFSVDMESDFMAGSNIKIVGMVPLSQKIIAMQYERTQAKSLKYYYDSQIKKEIK